MDADLRELERRSAGGDRDAFIEAVVAFVRAGELERAIRFLVDEGWRRKRRIVFTTVKTGAEDPEHGDLEIAWDLVMLSFYVLPRDEAARVAAAVSDAHGLFRGESLIRAHTQSQRGRGFVLLVRIDPCSMPGGALEVP